MLGVVLAATGLSGILLAVPRSVHAQTEIRRDVWFQNSCNRPVRLLVRHAEQARRWQSRGWWRLDPMERPRALTTRGRRIQHLSNHRLYYYAETLDGAVTWEGDGRNSARLGGVAYRLRRATPTVVRGRLQVRLSCSGAPATGGGRGGSGAPKG